MGRGDGASAEKVPPVVKWLSTADDSDRLYLFWSVVRFMPMTADFSFFSLLGVEFVSKAAPVNFSNCGGTVS